MTQIKEYVCMYVCRKLIRVGIEAFENSRVQYVAYKRSVRKGEQGPASGLQSQYVNSEKCGKLFSSIAGLYEQTCSTCKLVLWYS